MLIGMAEAPGIAAPQRHDVWAKADPIHRSANALIRVWAVASELLRHVDDWMGSATDRKAAIIA
jgi:hypothetical protein